MTIKSRIIQALIILSIFLFTGCNANKNNEDEKKSNIESESMKNITENMQKDIYPEIEKPFKKRSFSSYMDEKWIGNAISYGCYREGQAPGVKGPSEAEILEDLNILKQYWNLIRVYGSDSDTERILKVISEEKLPVKVMVGVWLENETKNPGRKAANIEQTAKAIELGNKYKDIIAAINVGNETQVFWSFHNMEMENLVKYIRYVRNNTEVPVTVADDYNFWNKPESKIVAAELDFIVCHIYPLWNGKTLDESIVWLEDIYTNQIKTMHEDYEIVLGEIGWATTYNPEKKGDGEQGSLVKGEVSVEAQEKFLLKLDEWIHKNKVTTFLFEAFDEPWKGGGENSGPNEIEKHWGVFYEDRTPKASFTNFLKLRN